MADYDEIPTLTRLAFWVVSAAAVALWALAIIHAAAIVAIG